MPSSFTSSFSRYLRRFFLGLAATLALALAASLALVKYYVEPNDRLIKSLDLVQRAEATNAAFGDSHFAWGFVGSRDFPFLGAEGETIPDMELRVRYYFRNRAPGKVVIQGDPHSFASYKLDRGTHAYLDDMDNYFWQRFIDHHRQYLALYWQRVMEGGLQVFRANSRFEWGWLAAEDEWSTRDSKQRVTRARARVEQQTPVADFAVQPPAESFRRILAFLRERGARICVVTTPVSYEYFEYANQSPVTAATIDFIRRVAEENQARYVNLYQRFARPEFTDHFRDADHLNQIGAPRFTEEVLSACFGPTTLPIATTEP